MNYDFEQRKEEIHPNLEKAFAHTPQKHTHEEIVYPSEETIEKEEESYDGFIFYSKGSEEEMKVMIKKVYTIKQNNPSKYKYERKLVCKSISCPSQALLVTYNQKNMCKLFFSIVDHAEDCKFQDKFGKKTEEEKLFEDPLFLSLVNSSLAPTLIIKNYNKEQKRRGNLEIKENEQLKRKISTFKYKLKQKDPIQSQADQIWNIEEFKKEISKHIFTNSNLSLLPDDLMFIVGSYFENNNFTVVLTSKNLLRNYVSQATLGPSLFVLDGTYKLNDLQYPTLVLGTIDKNRKFYLSNSFFKYQ